MRHARFDVAFLSVEGIDLPLRAGYLLVAESDDGVHPQWEVLAYGLAAAPLVQGPYRLAIRTLDDRHLSGDTVLVRSVDGAHVFRGAGPLGGVDIAELH